MKKKMLQACWERRRAPLISVGSKGETPSTNLLPNVSAWLPKDPEGDMELQKMAKKMAKNKK